MGIDEIGVRSRLQRAPHAQEAELAVHRPVFLVDTRAQAVRVRVARRAVRGPGRIRPRARAASCRVRSRQAQTRRGRSRALQTWQAPTASRATSSASVAAVPRASAISDLRRPGKEDHPLGVCGTSSKLRTSSASRLPESRRGGHRGPHACVEFAAERSRAARCTARAPRRRPRPARPHHDRA